MYLRKSRTDDPALTTAETVAKHEQMLDDWCMRNLGELVPETNRYREIVSGETIDARPEIKKVLRLCELAQYKAIIIVEPQRLSRGDLEDIGKISKILRYTGTMVITLQYSYDLTDERDRDYFERELKRGNEYLEYSKRIMLNGRSLSAEKGYYTGSRRPYGYNRVFKKEGNRRYPTLEIIQEEADIVRLIFQMYADGIGATKICSKLNAIGCTPLQGDMWTPPCIYPMLDNPLYIGKIKWGSRKTVKTVVGGEIVKSNPKNKECPVYDGKHEAIISDALWDAVRNRRRRKDAPRIKISRELQNPLSGIVFCECGRMMIRRPHSGKCADRYQCPNQPYCHNASCTVDELLEAVSEALVDAIADFQVQVASGNAPDSDEYLRTLRARLEDLEHKEVLLWEKFTEDGMPRHVFDKLLAKNEKQKQDVQSMIAEAESIPKPIDYQERIVTFHETVSAITDESIPAQTTNALLKSCIRRITYSREKGERVPGTKAKGGWTVRPMRLQIELNI